MKKKVISIELVLLERKTIVADERKNVVDDIEKLVKKVGFLNLFSLRSLEFDDPKYVQKIIDIGKDKKQIARFKQIEILADQLEDGEQILFGKWGFTALYTKRDLLALFSEINKIFNR
jgi:hypothetical protein